MYHDTLKQLGFRVERTGGGNTALVRQSTDGSVIFVTDGDLGHDICNLCDDCQVEVGWYRDADAPYEGDSYRWDSYDTAGEAVAAIIASLKGETHG